MFEYLKVAYSWFVAQNADFPFALLTVGALLFCGLWRWLHLASWDRFVAVLPKSDTSALKLWAHRVAQAWPSALLGAVVPVALAGGDWKGAGQGALWALAAPGLVLCKQLVQDFVGKLKAPPGSGLMILVLSFAGASQVLLACSAALEPGASLLPCDANDRAAEIDLAANAAKCQLEKKACSKGLTDSPEDADKAEACRQAVIVKCDRYVDERCALPEKK